MDESPSAASETIDFQPPSDYTVEPALRDPAPRPVPEFVYASDTHRNQVWSERGMLIVAGLCMTAQFVPAVQAFSVYLLPLAYIGWLGVALLLVYAAMFFFRLRGGGNLRYLTHGEPRVAQVVNLVKKPTVVMNDAEVQFAFVATVALHDPDTGAVVTEDIASENLPADQKGRYRTSLRVGDYVTVLHLPDQEQAPFQLYGFLNLDPEAQLIVRDGHASGVGDMLAVLLVVASVAALFVAFIAIEIYEPLAFPVTPLTILVFAATILLGLTATAWLFRRSQLARRQRAERNVVAMESGDAIDIDHEATGFFARARRAIYRAAIVAGVVMLGGAVAASGLFFVNGYFDAANPVPVPVRLHERYTETHAMVFRQYRVKYTIAGESQERTWSAAPAALDRLRFTEATALVKPGFLGWPWVETIVPVAGQPKGGIVAWRRVTPH